MAGLQEQISPSCSYLACILWGIVASELSLEAISNKTRLILIKTCGLPQYLIYLFIYLPYRRAMKSYKVLLDTRNCSGIVIKVGTTRVDYKIVLYTVVPWSKHK